jgi:hypothetical protein
MTSTHTQSLSIPGENPDRLAYLSAGISPAALRMTIVDWLTDLLHNLAQQAELVRMSAQMLQRFAACALPAANSFCKPCIEPIPHDRRFANQAWCTWPFNVISQSFLLMEKWWQEAAIGCSIFCVGTMRDRAAPWRSVYKLNLLTNAETTFLLTSGSHNVGIVNPPGVPGRSYQVLERAHDSNYLDPDLWLQVRSSKPVVPPPMGAAGYKPICPAPGTYALQQ